MPHCGFCLKALLTVSGVLKHIQNTDECCQARIKQIKSYSVHVVDLEEDGDAGPDISDEQLDDELDTNGGTYDFDPTAYLDPPLESEPPASPSPPPNHRASVEDVDDDDDDPYGTTRYIDEYPNLAGAVKAEADTKFERIRKEQAQQEVEPWAPFVDQDEWELARWLTQNVGQKQTDSFLKLPIVCNCLYFYTLSLPHRHFPDPKTDAAILQQQVLIPGKDR
jgi:hypothetical protein